MSFGLETACFLLLCQSSNPTISNTTASGQSKPVDLSPGLEDSAQKFLAVIEKGQPLELVNFWSESGVALGVDFENHPVSRGALREQVRKKGTLYCAFFDTGCLSKFHNEALRKAKRSPLATPDYSYRDLLRNARNKTLKVSTSREGDATMGYVRVRLENGELTKSSTRNELDFTFVLEAGGWKLAAIPEY